jgi:hypothetical protein
MRATKNGIELTKAELGALLAFTGDDMKFSVVHFQVNGGAKLVTRATDGKRAVECTAPSEGADVGEWAFDRTYLESVRRILDDGETIAVLEVNKRGANRAVIKGIESGDVRTDLKCPADSVSTQITMAQIHEAMKEANVDHSGSWFALNAFYLSDVQAIAKAADKCPITLFPPKDPRSPILFSASGAGGAWKGIVMPIAVVGPGDHADEDEPDEPPPGEPAEPKGLKLTPPLATEKKRRPKATKKSRPSRKGSAQAQA